MKSKGLKGRKDIQGWKMRIIYLFIYFGMHIGGRWVEKMSIITVEPNLYFMYGWIISKHVWEIRIYGWYMWDFVFTMSYKYTADVLNTMIAQTRSLTEVHPNKD